MKVLAWIGGALAVIAALLFTVVLGYRIYASNDVRWKVEVEQLHRSPSVVIAELQDTGLDRSALEDLADRMTEVLSGASPSIRVDGRGVLDGAARAHISAPGDLNRARGVLAQHFTADEYTLIDDGEGMISLKPTAASRARDLPAQRAEVVRVLQRRLAFAVTHVVWRSDGRLQIEALVDDPQIIASALEAGGALSFHLVHEASGPADVPVGYMLAPGFEGVAPEVVRRRPEFTGERLVRVNPAFDAQTGEPVLSFGLDERGTREFCRLTRQLTGERFAILFDGRVLTAPRINEPICGGSGQITGNFTVESVNSLALMLRSGPLPVRLRVVSMRGPRPT